MAQHMTATGAGNFTFEEKHLGSFTFGGQWPITFGGVRLFPVSGNSSLSLAA
jgi:hypothetical protein